MFIVNNMDTNTIPENHTINLITEEITKDKDASVSEQETLNQPPINTEEPFYFRDFILVSEFSELEGPVPLFVIPDLSVNNPSVVTEPSAPPSPNSSNSNYGSAYASRSGSRSGSLSQTENFTSDTNTNTPNQNSNGNYTKLGIGQVPLSIGKFNINQFVLRIMAVDNQNKSSELNAFAEDTQVVMTEPSENLAAYTHHLTLLDIYARGFVRPICLSYITRDKKKILNHFNQFLYHFNKVSSWLKQGNRVVFLRDLEARIADLNLTYHLVELKLNISNAEGNSKHQLNEDTKTAQEMDSQIVDLLSGATPETIQHYMMDLKGLYNKVKSQSDILVKYEKSLSLQIQNVQLLLPAHHKAKLISSLEKDSYFNRVHLRSLKELCVASQLVQTNVEDQIPTEEGLRAVFIETQESYDASLDELYRICTYFSRPSIVISLELQEHAEITTGVRLQSLSHQLQVQNPLTFSSKALSKFSSILSIGDIIQLDFNQPFWNSAIKANKRNSSHERQKRLSSNDNAIPLMQELNPREVVQQTEEFDMLWYYQPEATAQYNSSLSQLLEKKHNLRSFCDVLWGLNYSSVMASFQSHPLQKPSIQGTNDTNDVVIDINSVPTNETSSPHQINLHADSGAILLQLRSKISFLKHIIFSLLKGRPVIIHALPSNENIIRETIRSFCVFIPGIGKSTCANRVTFWQTTNLKVADLGKAKIIGYSKQKQIPKVIEKYVTVWDYEAETVKCPSYSGFFIEDMLNRKQWPDGNTFLAYVEYVLFELSMKAWMYYQCCCIGPIVSQDAKRNTQSSSSSSSNIAQSRNQTQSNSFKFASMDQTPPTTRKIARVQSNSTAPPVANELQRQNVDQFTSEGRENTRRSMSDSQLSAKFPPQHPVTSAEYSRISFWKKLGIHRNDVEIVEHLVEIVKEQQVLSIQGIKNMVPTIRLDYSASQLFKNMKKSHSH